MARWRCSSAKKNLRVVIAPGVFDACAGQAGGIGRLDLRTALGGVLAQEQDRVVEAWDAWPSEGGPEVVTKRAPSDAEWKALRFAWRVCAHVKSNTVIFTGRRSDAGRRGRPDEPRGRGQRRPDEGSVRPAFRLRARWPRQTRSFRSETASTRWWRPARRRSFSLADPCATRKSSRRPTSTASRWSSRAGAISGIRRAC